MIKSMILTFDIKFISKDSVIAKVLTYEEIKELQDKNKEDTFLNPQKDDL